MSGQHRTPEANSPGTETLKQCCAKLYESDLARGTLIQLCATLFERFSVAQSCMRVTSPEAYLATPFILGDCSSPSALAPFFISRRRAASWMWRAARVLPLFSWPNASAATL